MAKRGRPKIKWSDDDYKKFEALCGIMCTQEEICGVMGVSDKTLCRLICERYGGDGISNFPDAFERFSAAGKMNLRRSQFRLARKNATMAIFLGKVYLKQRESFDDMDMEDTDALYDEIEATGAQADE